MIRTGAHRHLLFLLFQFLVGDQHMTKHSSSPRFYPLFIFLRVSRLLVSRFFFYSCTPPFSIILIANYRNPVLQSSHMTFTYLLHLLQNRQNSSLKPTPLCHKGPSLFISESHVPLSPKSLFLAPCTHTPIESCSS